jgi:nitrite reductase (NADH) small subunit/3-phenylpropionate/trans-cinnamate dioxygenase ferredoxin subunit
VEIAKRADLPPGRGRALQAGGRALALFNDGGTFFAIDDTCPHQGASLGEGILHQGLVICPMHAWMFSIVDGQCPSVPDLSVSCYPTRLAGDAVEVELPEETA